MCVSSYYKRLSGLIPYRATSLTAGRLVGSYKPNGAFPWRTAVSLLVSGDSRSARNLRFTITLPQQGYLPVTATRYADFIVSLQLRVICNGVIRLFYVSVYGLLLAIRLKLTGYVSVRWSLGLLVLHSGRSHGSITENQVPVPYIATKFEATEDR